MLEADLPIGDLRYRMSGIVDGGLLLEDLLDPADGFPGHHQHHIDHGQHHQGHQDHHGIGDQVLQLAGGHGDAGQDRPVSRTDNSLGGKPGDQGDADIDPHLHEKRVKGDGGFRLGKIRPDLLGDIFKLLGFVVLPYKAFHHPDAVEVFPDDAVEPVIGFEHPVKNGMGDPGDAHQADKQDGDHHHIDQPDLPIGGKGHKQSAHNRDGRFGRHPQDHHNGVLHVHYVRGHAGDQAVGGEFVDVGKGEVLDARKHGVPQIP